jgi:membrane-associated protein
MPFLPGDSLLFVVGALCGLGLMSLPLAMAAADRGGDAGQPDQLRHRPPRRARVFGWQKSRWFNRDAFDRMHAFYERYGGVTIVLARFMPFLRTFAPFVAGVAQMTRSKFTFYDVTGGTLWVCSLTLAGYLFGNVPWVQANLSTIIWADDRRAGGAGAVRRLEGAARSRRGGCRRLRVSLKGRRRSPAPRRR